MVWTLNLSINWFVFCFDPQVCGLDVNDPDDTVKRLQELTERPIGVNLEPVDSDAKMESTKFKLPESRIATAKSMKKAEELSFSFVCFTGNRGSGVTNRMIVKAVKTAKANFSGMIIAGKMHGAGVDEPVADEESVKAMIDAGADVIVTPAVWTVPGFTSDELIKIVKLVHAHNGLVMSTIGTSQEGAGRDVIREIALKTRSVV